MRQLVPHLCTSLAFLLSPLLAHSNVVGAGTQNFNPTTSGLDYVTVQSSKTLAPGIFNIGVFGNYAVNSLPYVDSGGQNHTRFNDTLTSSDVNIGFGLAPRWDLGLSLPAVLAQQADDSGVYGNFASNGMTETRLNTKYRVSGDEDGGVALVASVNFLAIEDDPFSGSGAGPTYNLEAVVDRTLDRQWTAAFNFGHRWRNSGTPIANFPIEPMGNQFIASAATSYLYERWDTKVIGEIFGAFPAQSEGSNPTRNLTSAEALVGAKHDFTQQLAGHAGLGTELAQGVSSPDWRIYAGLNYTFGPVWDREEKVVSEPAAIPEKFHVGNILFDTNSATLAHNYREILAGLVENLRRQPFKKLTVEGHTDSVGSATYNMDLSRRRAEAIRDYLVNEEKLPAEKVEAIGYGPERPIASNGNFQGRQKNRRVEFVIAR